MRPSRKLPGAHRRRVAFAAPRIEQVRALDEADVGREQLRKLLGCRPASVERRQEPVDDRNAHGGDPTR
jgi:hypothetical protein